MCVNQREITNKYTGHKLYVKCGHLSCLLARKRKAHRVSRIKAKLLIIRDYFLLLLIEMSVFLMFVGMMRICFLEINLVCVVVIPLELDEFGNRSYNVYSINCLFIVIWIIVGFVLVRI